MGGSEQGLMIGLRLIHIIAGVFWVGTTMAIARFIVPAIKANGEAGAVLMRDIMQRRRLPVYLNIAGALTLLSGLGMYWRLIRISNGSFSHSTMGMTLGIGALLAIAGSIIGNAVSRPAAARMGALGAQIAAAGGTPNEAQRATLGALDARLRMGSIWGLICLLLATAAMAVARYL